jgi:mRNA-degrading endonuclease RelE of RelBE toxin-antitoxin system
MANAADRERLVPDAGNHPATQRGFLIPRPQICVRRAAGYNEMAAHGEVIVQVYEIELTSEAIEDLAAFRKFDRVRVVAAMEAQLTQEPTTEARNRKQLRPNQLAEWALRIDEFRVFYDVLKDEAIVKVVAVGMKRGNQLYLRGEKFEL